MKGTWDMAQQTIKHEHENDWDGNDDDLCGRVMDMRAGAQACLAEADALPDGAPEQIGALLRGVLAAQVGTLELVMSMIERQTWRDGWPQTHAEQVSNGAPLCPPRNCPICDDERAHGHLDPRTLRRVHRSDSP